MLRESIFSLKFPAICFVRRKCAAAHALPFLSVLVWRQIEVRVEPLACSKVHFGRETKYCEYPMK